MHASSTRVMIATMSNRHTPKRTSKAHSGAEYNCLFATGVVTREHNKNSNAALRNENKKKRKKGKEQPRKTALERNEHPPF